jgi:hypothetical protein
MHHIQQFFFYTGIFAAILLLLGLFKPWALLWWEDVQNRGKVIKLYGSISLVFFTLYMILHLTKK